MYQLPRKPGFISMNWIKDIMANPGSNTQVGSNAYKLYPVIFAKHDHIELLLLLYWITYDILWSVLVLS